MGTHGQMAMKRMHIMLTDAQRALLRDESEATDLSMGELIRRAVDHVYRPHVRPRVHGWELFAGIWRRPDAAVAGRRVRART
jgi:hypothetical protein